MLASAYDRSRGFHGDHQPLMAFPEIDPTDGEAQAVSKVAEPERRLLLAVLTDAIVRVRQLATGQRHHARRELVESERWIRSDDRSWPYSFVNVCAALDLEHGPIRRTVLGWLRTSPTTVVTRRALLVGRTKPRRRRKTVAGATVAVSAVSAVVVSAATRGGEELVAAAVKPSVLGA